MSTAGPLRPAARSARGGKTRGGKINACLMRRTEPGGHEQGARFQAAGMLYPNVSAGAGSPVRLAVMRMIGPVESPRGFGLQDHVCWVHGDPWDYRPRLTEFFSEGLERGLQVAYLGAGNVEELREHIDRFIDVGPLLAREDIRVISFDEIYGAGEPVDPAEVIKSTPPQHGRR